MSVGVSSAREEVEDRGETASKRSLNAYMSDVKWIGDGNILKETLRPGDIALRCVAVGLWVSKKLAQGRAGAFPLLVSLSFQNRCSSRRGVRERFLVEEALVVVHVQQARDGGVTAEGEHAALVARGEHDLLKPPTRGVGGSIAVRWGGAGVVTGRDDGVGVGELGLGNDLAFVYFDNIGAGALEACGGRSGREGRRDGDAVYGVCWVYGQQELAQSTTDHVRSGGREA